MVSVSVLLWAVQWFVTRQSSCWTSPCPTWMLPRTSMRTEIIKLHKKLATTFIYVTHDQTEAMTMGDRIVVMKDGIIQQVDTPQNLYDMPCNMFVAGFTAAPR